MKYFMLAIFLIAMLVSRGFGDATTRPDPNVFHSKLGDFTCTLPFLLPGYKSGDQVDSGNEFVSFNDDVGTLLRIEEIKIAPDKDEEQAGEPQHQTLLHFFHDQLLPEEYLAAAPDTTIVGEDYVDTAVGKAYFAAINIPHGSTLAASVGGGKPERLDSFRGIMVFWQHDILYVVSTQEPPRDPSSDPTTKPSGGQKERVEARLEDLRKVLGGMTFR